MALSAHFFILCLLHLYIFCCAAKADEPVGYEHGDWGKEKAEWMDRCLAQYEKTDKKDAEKPPREKEKEKKTEAAEEESYEVYPKNYEAAYDYEKLHVSDVILPLKIHRQNYRKEQYADGVGYGKESDEKEAKDVYNEYERQGTQEPYEEEYSSAEERNPSAGRRPYHYEPNRGYPKSKKGQYHRRGFRQHPYRFAPFPHYPRGIVPPPPPFVQHLPPLVPPVPQPTVSATTVLPPLQQPTVSSPSAVVPNVAPCRRKSLAKCSAFSQCVNGTATVQSCWATGPEMVFDDATQGCRSFAGVPECQKDVYCKNRPPGWTFVGGDCTKISFLCGMTHPDSLRVCNFPDFVVVSPIDKRSCVGQFAVEKCAHMLGPGSG